MVTLRAAGPEDRAAAESLLRACGLMGLDDGAQFGSGFVVAFDADGALVGMAGLEIHGPGGLLRSVAVADSARSQGLGARLVADRLAWAHAHGVAALYLLTTDGEGYFARHGFVRMAREEAPPGIAASHQWSTACPASSVAMRLAKV